MMMANMSGDELAELIKKCTVVLVDVAGTTTSIDFVQKTLRSYVVDNANKYLTEHWTDEAVQETVSRLKNDSPDFPKDASKEDQVTAIVSRLTDPENGMEASENLKALHGIIYEQGYESGDIKGHVYEDVAVAFHDWFEVKKRICVYSSGSVRAQRLLFTKSVSGDLSSYIAEYFDLSVGVKTEKASYAAIADKLNCTPGDIIFFTDSVDEAEAATNAGVKSVLVIRETVKDVSKKFISVKSFTELPVSGAQKRKYSEDENLEDNEDRTSKVAKIDEKTKDSSDAVNGINKTDSVEEEADKSEKGSEKIEDKKTELENKTDLDQKPTEISTNDKTANVTEGCEQDEKMDTSEVTETVENKKEETAMDVTPIVEEKKDASSDKGDNTMKTTEKEESVKEEIPKVQAEVQKKETEQKHKEEIIIKEKEAKNELEKEKSNKDTVLQEKVEVQKESVEDEGAISKINEVDQKEIQEESSCENISSETSQVSSVKETEESKKSDKESENSKKSDKESENSDSVKSDIKTIDVNSTDEQVDSNKKIVLESGKETNEKVIETEKAAVREAVEKKLKASRLSLDAAERELSEAKRAHSDIQQQIETVRVQVENATRKYKEAELVLEQVRRESLDASVKLGNDESKQKNVTAEIKNGIENGVSMNGEKEIDKVETNGSGLHKNDSSNGDIGDDRSKLEKCEANESKITEIPVAVAVNAD